MYILLAGETGRLDTISKSDISILVPSPLVKYCLPSLVINNCSSPLINVLSYVLRPLVSPTFIGNLLFN